MSGMMQRTLQSWAAWTAACTFAAGLTLAANAQNNGAGASGAAASSGPSGGATQSTAPSANGSTQSTAGSGGTVTTPNTAGSTAPGTAGNMNTKPGMMPIAPGSQSNPALTATGAARNRFGTFGTLGNSDSPNSFGLQGSAPNTPGRSIPLSSNTSYYSLKSSQLADINQPVYGRVYGNAAAGSTTINPSFITYDNTRPADAKDISGKGYYTGTITVKDGKATLHSDGKDYMLNANDKTPIYSASPAKRDQFKSGSNVFIGRQYGENGAWGDYNSAYMLPEGTMPPALNDLNSSAHSEVQDSTMPKSSMTDTNRSSFDHSTNSGNSTTMGQMPAGSQNGQAPSGAQDSSTNGGSPSSAK